MCTPTAIDCPHRYDAREGGREGLAGVASDDTPHLFIKLQLKSLNRNGRKLDDDGGHGVGSERGSGERGRPFVHPTAASGISCCSTPQQIVIIIGAGLTHNP